MTPPDKDLSVVVFQTDTLLDRRSFTTFGLNAKPNTTTPIGFFGTGLKYAIAVLVREGIPLSIYSGALHYEFYVRKTKYRESDVQEIKCRIRKTDQRKPSKPSYIRLPFTTELGKTWELWQAFRELESNTRDEGGTTTLVPDGSIPIDSKDKTQIIVRGNAFTQVYHDRASIFLPDSLRRHKFAENMPEGESVDVEVFDEPSRYVYYRGVRVLDLNQNNYRQDREENPITSRYTYNFVRSMDLTEDRTLKYPFLALATLGRFLSTCRNKDLVKAVLAVDEERFWESEIDFDNQYTTPSNEFMGGYSEVAKPLAGARKFMTSYTARTNPPPPWQGLSRKDTYEYARARLKEDIESDAERKFLEAVVYHMRDSADDATEVETDDIQF